MTYTATDYLKVVNWQTAEADDFTDRTTAA